MMMPWGMFGGPGSGWGAGILMLLVMVGFWILLIVGVILVVKWLVEQGRPPAGGSAAARESALDILKKRYARGEIDREEFEGKKRDLL